MDQIQAQTRIGFAKIASLKRIFEFDLVYLWYTFGFQILVITIRTILPVILLFFSFDSFLHSIFVSNNKRFWNSKLIQIGWWLSKNESSNTNQVGQ